MPSPRKRAWIANLEADPHLTVHLKGPVAVADLPATARVVVDETERRQSSIASPRPGGGRTSIGWSPRAR